MVCTWVTTLVIFLAQLVFPTVSEMSASYRPTGFANKFSTSLSVCLFPKFLASRSIGCYWTGCFCLTVPIISRIMARICSAMFVFNCSMALVYSDISRSMARVWSDIIYSLKALVSNLAISSVSKSLTRQPVLNHVQANARWGSISAISLWVRNMHGMYAWSAS